MSFRQDNSGQTDMQNLDAHQDNNETEEQVILKKLPTEEKLASKALNANTGKFKTIIGAMLILSITGWLYLFTGSSTYKYDEAVVQSGVTKEVKPGTVLLKKDNENIAPKDYTINVGNTNDQLELFVWDYGGEDGDYVQVFVNDSPITQPFMIFHKPERIKVPSKGVIKIKGIRDGGGGITYAVQVKQTGETYFNLAPINGSNTYTLINSQ